MEYYSTMRKEDILMTAWMALERIIQREISQMEKDKEWMVSLICGI